MWCVFLLLLGLKVYGLLVPFVEIQPVDGSLVVEVHERWTITVITCVSANAISAATLRGEMKSTRQVRLNADVHCNKRQ